MDQSTIKEEISLLLEYLKNEQVPNSIHRLFIQSHLPDMFLIYTEKNESKLQPVLEQLKHLALKKAREEYEHEEEDDLNKMLVVYLQGKLRKLKKK